MALTAVSNNHSAMNANRYLTKIISTLSTSANFKETIQNLTCLGAESLADWCGIYMFENDQTIRRLAVAPVEQVEALFPLDLHSSTGPAHVRRTAEQQILTSIEDDIAVGLGMKPEELLLPDGRRPSIYACLPAVARNSAIGAVVFMSSDPNRSFGEIEIPLARSLANAAAVAMDNSKLYREAQEANRLKDEFVAMVSHELRTPLTPMLGCIHLLRTAKLSQQNFDRALDMIERNAQTQLHIVEDLLDASRIVAGKLHLIMKSTAAVPILEAALETIRSFGGSEGHQDHYRLCGRTNGDRCRSASSAANFLELGFERCEVHAARRQDCCFGPRRG